MLICSIFTLLSLLCILSCIFRCYRFTDNYKKEEDKQNEVYIKIKWVGSFGFFLSVLSSVSKRKCIGVLASFLGDCSHFFMHL